MIANVILVRVEPAIATVTVAHAMLLLATETITTEGPLTVVEMTTTVAEGMEMTTTAVEDPRAQKARRVALATAMGGASTVLSLPDEIIVACVKWAVVSTLASSASSLLRRLREREWDFCCRKSYAAWRLLVAVMMIAVVSNDCRCFHCCCSSSQCRRERKNSGAWWWSEDTQ